MSSAKVPETREAAVPVIVATVGTEIAVIATAIRLAGLIRAGGVAVIVDSRAGRLKKKFQLAESQRSYFVLAVGEREAAEGTASVRDMDEHSTTEMRVEEAAAFVIRGCGTYAAAALSTPVDLDAVFGHLPDLPEARVGQSGESGESGALTDSLIARIVEDES